MTGRPEALLRHLLRLASPPIPNPVTDAELLRRFALGRDEAAFAELVRRHGGLVLGVCRRVLRDAHRAEDAFQAVWLVLARKAAAIRPASSLTAWLHSVARQVALNARRGDVRRRKHERKARRAAPAPADPLDELTARECLLILDEEVQRLPEVYRLAVLCRCFEGLSQEEVARRLGWTPGSVKGHLERGRKLLHERLAKRGLTLSAALAAVEVSRGAPGVSASLAVATVRAALAGQAGAMSAGVEALADAAMAGVTPGKFKVALALGAAAVGAGVVTQSPPAKDRLSEPKQAAINPDPKAKRGPAGTGKDLYGDPLPPGAVARLGTVRFRHTK